MKAMISFRHFFSMLLVGVFFVSCAPYPPEGPARIALLPAPLTEVEKDALQMAEAEKQAEESRKNLEEKLKNAQQDPALNPPLNGRPAFKSKNSKYPTAAPTRKGFVKNPYTGNEVDIRGIPSGSLVVDPEDPNRTTNKFRVP